jgi:hypothetical protein
MTQGEWPPLNRDDDAFGLSLEVKQRRRRGCEER